MKNFIIKIIDFFFDMCIGELPQLPKRYIPRDKWSIIRGNDILTNCNPEPECEKCVTIYGGCPQVRHMLSSPQREGNLGKEFTANYCPAIELEFLNKLN